MIFRALFEYFGYVRYSKYCITFIIIKQYSNLFSVYFVWSINFSLRKVFKFSLSTIIKGFINVNWPFMFLVTLPKFYPPHGFIDHF